MTDPKVDWDVSDTSARDGYRKKARAAISAMREPSDAMLKAEMDLGGLGYGDEAYQAVPIEIWQAMIDAALKPR